MYAQPALSCHEPQAPALKPGTHPELHWRTDSSLDISTVILANSADLVDVTQLIGMPHQQ